MELILASASPRRAELLRAAGFRFETVITDSNEMPRPGESAVALVLRLAEAKARAAAVVLRDGGRQPPNEPAIVIGADTVVELDGEIFGKPGSADAARRMLRLLSGKTHHVHTGIALIRLADGEVWSAVETTCVRFVPLDEDEIEQYITIGEPLDKAGAYGVQGFAGRFVDRIDGCYFNVVGLPLAALYRLLKELGWQRA